MEKFKITLAEIELEIPLNKVKELVKYLEMDEIVDGLAINNKIDSLVDRLCMDYEESIAKLLHEFFNHKSDANKYLPAEQQEELESEFQIYLSKRCKL